MTRPKPRGQSKQAAAIRQRGVSIISAIFMLLLFAALAAYMVSLSSSANITSAQDVQGARAYQAAQAGLEWGLLQVLDPGNATVVAPAAPTWPNTVSYTHLDVYKRQLSGCVSKLLHLASGFRQGVKQTTKASARFAVINFMAYLQAVGLSWEI